MNAFIALVPTPVKIAVVGALAVLAAFYAGDWRGRSVATSLAEARAARATLEQLRERGLINEKVHGLDDCALLRELAPDSLCDDLDQ